MAFGKKKKNADNYVYDLDCHSDKPVYESEEIVTQTPSGISDFPDHLLIAELEFRGYTVTKK